MLLYCQQLISQHSNPFDSGTEILDMASTAVRLALYGMTAVMLELGFKAGVPELLFPIIPYNAFRFIGKLNELVS